MPNAFASIGFMPHVREEQKRFGSAGAYARLLSPDRLDGGELTAREAEFLSARDGIYQATVSETGWPYVQFRGGGRFHQGHRPKGNRIRGLSRQPAIY